MTTKPKARKFRIRRSEPLSGGAATGDGATDRGATQPRAPEQGIRVVASSATQSGQDGISGNIDSPRTVASENDIDAIRREGLTGRQLRMARRVAQKNGLAVTSDFDAVRQLRERGIDPFQRTNILELVIPNTDELDGGPGGQERLPQVTTGNGRVQLPQTVPDPQRNLPSTDRVAAAAQRASEIRAIQRDIARRRRRATAMLAARLFTFVMLPTILAGYYFYVIATPMYATNTEFVIQNAQSTSAAAGLGSLFAGTSMATQQDSITVQAYLTSRAAMMRLDQDHGFKAHFSQTWIDPIQRLPANASNEDAYKLYQSHVKLSYDPTEGILKMEVIAADPKTSQEFAEALVGYAEEQVDQLTRRLREDQLAGAQKNFDLEEARRVDYLQKLLDVQNQVAVIDPVSETASVMSQITALQTQLSRKQLELATMQSATRPNQGRVDALQQEISNLNQLIADNRSKLTQTDGNNASLASKSSEVRMAEENYQAQVLRVQQAQSMLEVARTEANRQVRYLSMGVQPIAPDKPTYPRAFENTILTFLIFAGIYLMLSLTASILREQMAA
ncbi:MAG: capsule biosynthesis protein [Limimaricola sp.]|uniref:capsule biosynthesis protein n=1 Tax=Limimaricola sp. TaxID=2211665 RepID=UPI001D9538A9|nr:capsule biosynthesis protein [Limimaricola sp.]MBI1415774.1 capsule biosynthesis protein [Limimaricola sp.]